MISTTSAIETRQVSIVNTHNVYNNEDYLAGNAKIKISIKKQNGVVVIFGEPWQLLLTGSAVPRIRTHTLSFCLDWFSPLHWLL